MLQNRKKNFFIHKIVILLHHLQKIAIIEFQIVNYAKSIINCYYRIVINFLFYYLL